jgi:hypothetical protein
MCSQNIIAGACSDAHESISRSLILFVENT